MLGTFQGFQPKFVKRYAELGRDPAAGAAAFAEEVRSRRFPGPEHVFADTLACRTRRSYIFHNINYAQYGLTPPAAVPAVFHHEPVALTYRSAFEPPREIRHPVVAGELDTTPLSHSP